MGETVPVAVTHPTFPQFDIISRCSLILDMWDRSADGESESERGETNATERSAIRGGRTVTGTVLSAAIA